MADQAEAQVAAVLIAVSNKVGTPDAVGEQVFYQKTQHISALSHRACQVGGELPSYHSGPVAPVPEKRQGIKRFNTVTAFISSNSLSTRAQGYVWWE